MEEIWKDVRGFEGLYQISNFGRVRSLDRIDSMGRLHLGQILKITDNSHGYKKVTLCKNSVHTNKYIHRLVAEAFISNPNNLSEVNHKDEDKSNNSIDNLEWVSHRDNMEYGTRKERHKAKISGANNVGAKKVICITTGEVFATVKEASEKYGVFPQNLGASIRKNHYCGKLEDGTKLKWSYYEEEVK